jgi:hypothetical protein
MYSIFIDLHCAQRHSTLYGTKQNETATTNWGLDTERQSDSMINTRDKVNFTRGEMLASLLTWCIFAILHQRWL